MNLSIMETSIRLQDCIQVCNEFNKTLKKSFGPRSQVVFFLSSTGQVEFTTSGLKIINSLHVRSPIAQIIQRSLEKYHNRVGDGSKIFLLLLNEIFVNIVEMKKVLGNDYKIKLIYGFNFLLHIVLPKCFQILKFKIQSFIPKDINIPHYLLKTYFCGKFGAIISEKLSDLTYKFLINCCPNLNSSAVNYIIDHFDTVCMTTGSLSISNSKIKPGIILSQDFLINCKDEIIRNSALKFIIYISNSNDNLTESSLCVSTRQTISKLFEVNYNNNLTIMENIRQRKISVIICSGTFTDSLRSLCRQFKINIISLVSLEEINYLLFLSQVEPVYDLLNPLTEKNCRNLNFIKSIQVGNKNYTYLGLQCSQSIIQPHHLLLCGPTESICKQYSKECLNSLKLIYCWRKDNQFLEFEEKCDTCDISRVNESNINFNKNINELMCKLRIDDEKLSKENSESVPATIIPGGCCWEIFFHYILENINLSNCPLEVSMACKILSKSLLIVPQTFFDNNHNVKVRFIQMITSIIEQLKLDNIYAFNEWGEILSIKEADVFEPIASKELLIFSVIQLVTQLLRVHSIINI